MNGSWSPRFRQLVSEAVVERLAWERRHGKHPDERLVAEVRAFLADLMLSGVVPSGPEQTSLDAVASRVDAEPMEWGPSVAVSRKEAAQMLDISVRTLDRLTASGSIPAMKVGRRTVIARSSINSYVTGGQAS